MKLVLLQSETREEVAGEWVGSAEEGCKASSILACSFQQTTALATRWFCRYSLLLLYSDEPNGALKELSFLENPVCAPKRTRGPERNHDMSLAHVDHNRDY